MEDLGDFSIPPIPTRLGNVQRTNELFDLIGNEGLMNDIDEDGSLSLLTDEVLQAQKCQLTELDSKRQTLMKLQTQFRESEKEFESICKEVEAINRQIFLIQNGLEKTSKSCSSLEQQIKHTLLEKKRLREMTVNTKWYGIGQSKQFEKYREKIKGYSDSVETFMAQSDLSNSLRGKKMDIDSLKEQLEIEDLEKSCYEMETTTCDLQKFKEKLQSEISNLETQTKKEEDKTKIMGKEYEALQRRDILSINRLKQNIEDINSQVAFLQQENSELRLQLKPSCKF